MAQKNEGIPVIPGYIILRTFLPLQGTLLHRRVVLEGFAERIAVRPQRRYHSAWRYQVDWWNLFASVGAGFGGWVSLAHAGHWLPGNLESAKSKEPGSPGTLITIIHQLSTNGQLSMQIVRTFRFWQDWVWC